MELHRWKVFGVWSRGLEADPDPADLPAVCFLRVCYRCAVCFHLAFPWTAVESPSVEPHRWKTSTSLPRLRLPPLEFGRSIAEPHRWNTLKPSTDVEENGKNFTGGSSSIPLELSRVLSTETVGIRRGNDRNGEKIHGPRLRAERRGAGVGLYHVSY